MPAMTVSANGCVTTMARFPAPAKGGNIPFRRNANAVGHEFLGPGSGHRHHAGLGRGVIGLADIAGARNAGDVDDDSAGHDNHPVFDIHLNLFYLFSRRYERACTNAKA
jgi:hypothetical protein